MLKYYDISESLLQNKAFEAEALYCCNDSGFIYLDSIAEGKRIKLGSDVVICATEAGLPLAPIPNKIYCILETGQMKTYNNGEWTILGGITQIHIPNVLVENGKLIINDTRIKAKDTAQFNPDLSVADLVSSSSCVCADGSVTITVTTTGTNYTAIPGEVIIN